MKIFIDNCITIKNPCEELLEMANDITLPVLSVRRFLYRTMKKKIAFCMAVC